MLGNNFKIKLEMLSDWQIGTGAGIPGSIDELVSKDVDGFPQVPAKTLVGIWRDALERLCDGLGGNWSNWVEVIFGNQPNVEKKPDKAPVSAILSLQPARISENLRAKIGDDKRLKQALTFVKVGIKIDEASGTSSTDMLRFEEMGRIGTVLDSDVECEKMNETISALLILSAKLVERIGGKRRRGAGKCQLEIVGITNKEIEAAVKTIRENKTSADKKIENKKISFTKNASDWQTCEYTLTLETPVSIVTAVLGNVSETLDFIPGTYLISHFVKHFGQDIFKEIQANNFQISPATICIDNKRGFPVPKVFAQEKMKKDKVYNRLRPTLEGKEQTKPIREGYISDLSINSVSHATTPQTLLMHNTVDDNFQRPTADVVGVYSREAIKAGTILKGEIRFRNLQFDCKELDGKVRIGTSKKDDYGLAKIEFGKAAKFEAKSVSKPDELIVYLASDVMLRNGNLRQTNLVGDFAEALGLGEIKKEEIKYQQIQVRRIESWQTGWGLPRPTLTLMQAGSVVRFESKKLLDFAKIEAEGIGERRGEGYGQIIFNPPVLDVLQPTWETIKKDFKERNKCQEKEQKSEAEIQREKEEIQKEIDKKFTEAVSKDASLKSFAKLIEETAWREEIKIAVSKIAVDDAKKENAKDQIFGFKGLNMSQIGGLRSVIMRLQSKSDKSLVENWLNHLQQTKNRLDKWEEWRIKKVKDVLKDDNIWEKLKGDFHEPKSLELEHNLKEELWAEAVKSLFYACQHAHKRDTEKTEKEDETNG